MVVPNYLKHTLRVILAFRPAPQPVERLVMRGDDYTAWYWETLPSLPQTRSGTTLSPTLDNTGVRIIGGGGSDVLELAPADGSSSWTKVENVSYSGGLHTVAPILAC